MRIGIDATCWTNTRGFGRFTRSLAQALLAIDRANEYVLFFDRTYPACADVPANAQHVVVRTACDQTAALAADGRRSAADLLRMTMAVAREPVDVFFCPSIDSYFPILRPAARVVMIHDVIPETMPETALPSAAARRRRRAKVAFALRQARVVATGSAAVARQVEDVFGIAPARLAIVPYGVSDAFQPATSIPAAREHVQRAHGLHTPYVLNVSGAGPHKNLVRLVEAFARVATGREISLAFVGIADADDDARAVAPIVTRHELRDRIRFLGVQSDRELIRLYQAADAVVVPSLQEGFGLPALEAACCGTPVAVTKNSPLPSVLGEAGHAFDPFDVGDIGAAIERALGERATASRRALPCRQRFSWTESANRALQAFSRAMEAR